MTAMIHTFDGQRHAVLVDPHEIRAGDWMRDLGRLRQVEAEPVHEHTAVLVRFADYGDGQYATLSIPRTIPAVTVWRELVDTGAAARAQA